MESLALLVAIIILFSWSVAALSLFFSFIKLKLIGALLGLFSIIIGTWFLFTLPHAPFFGLINIVPGIISIKRYFNNK